MGDEGITAGQAQKIIGIDYAILGLEERIDLVEVGDDDITIRSDQILHVESGSAKVLGASDPPVFIERGGNISALRGGEKVTLMPGDTIRTIRHGDFIYGYGGQIKVVSGAISIRFSYRTHIAKGEAVIVKEAGKMKLVIGETTIHTNGRILEFPPNSTFSYTYMDDSYYSDIIFLPYETCQSIKYFSSDIHTYLKNDIFSFGWFALQNLILMILGVFSTVILKHTNWRILIYSFIYLFILYIFASILASMFEAFVNQKISFDGLESNSLLSFFYNYGMLLHINFGRFSGYSQGIMSIGVSLAFLLVTVLFILFALIQSIGLIKTKKYKSFPFINFVSLPVALGYVVYIISWQIIGYLTLNVINYYPLDLIKYIIWVLVFFFLCYLILAPIFRKALIYFMSLPKE